MNFAGVFYRSRYGHSFENWAIFEPFPLRIPNQRIFPRTIRISWKRYASTEFAWPELAKAFPSNQAA